jgi:FKBP-type peptidyl-prolyl cis-trans isomerase (trigger factor)
MTGHGVRILSVPKVAPFGGEVSAFDDLAVESRQAALQERVLAQVLSESEVEVAEPLIDQRIGQMIDQFKARLASSGVGFDDYLAQAGKSEATMRDELRFMASEVIKKEAVLNHLALINGIEARPEDLDARVEAIAQMMDIHVDEARRQYASGANVAVLSQTIVFEKVVDLLVAQAMSR